MAVRIVTDSASDLPQDICDELGIEVVSLTIRFGDAEYVDRKELSTEDFWRKLAASSVLPETAAPSVGAFEETFRRLADAGADGIICINLSASLSATMQSAQVAAKALDGLCPVAIVDSKSASMGIGNLVLHAAARASDGADLDTIVREVEERVGRQHLLAALDTLEYLRKGGRIGGAKAMLGSMLSIKPIVDISSGAVEEAAKVRTRKKQMVALRDLLVKAGEVEHLTVCDGLAGDVDEFFEVIAEVHDRADLGRSTIGPVIGTHGGPGMIGLTWIDKA